MYVTEITTLQHSPQNEKTLINKCIIIVILVTQSSYLTTDESKKCFVFIPLGMHTSTLMYRCYYKKNLLGN